MPSSTIPPSLHECSSIRPRRRPGRIVGPDGQPLADVAMLAYSKVNPQDFSGDNYGSFVRTRSAEDGTFRLRLTKGGSAVFWVVPDNFAPRQLVVDAKRGDYGDVRLEPGVGLKGQVVDVAGQPVPNVWVVVSDKKSQSEIHMPVASSLCRSAQTDAAGRFEIGPMKAGEVTLGIEPYPQDIRLYDRGRARSQFPPSSRAAPSPSATRWGNQSSFGPSLT